MFSIAFTTNTVLPVLKDKRTAGVKKIGQNTVSPSMLCHGSLTLGSYVEQFESPLHFWNRDAYESQWNDALSRLLAGSTKTALITAMYDPGNANFMIWWPLYLEGDTVFVQNQLLFFDQMKMAFDLSRTDEIVHDHTTTNPDGIHISEWAVPLSDVKAFSGRMKRGLKGRGRHKGVTTH